MTQVVRESATISSIHLADPDGERLPPARPGQYLSVRVPVGPHGAVRSYSVSSTDAYRISVKHEPHGQVSGYIHVTVRAGDTLEVAAPRGDFVLGEDNRPVVLVSAGVGITPVLAMLHRLAAQRSEREIWWLHTIRRPQEQAFAGETQDLLASLPHVHARTYYSAESRLSAARLAELKLPADAVAYVCGPTGFMTDMAEGLRAAGLDRVYSETFGTLAPITPGIRDKNTKQPHQPAGKLGRGPEITFARSGISAAFTEGSILEFAESCDVPARWACRSGVCRTCETPLLSGEVNYSPAPLENPTPGTVLLCCARPRTDVVLDM